MAPRNKPKVKKLKFELTRSAIAGIGVVCFCIFLWMFLLGVWAGQSLLLPAPEHGKDVAADAAQAIDLPVLQADAKKKIADE